MPLSSPRRSRLKEIFFSAVSHGKSVGFWNTSPLLGEGPLISSPLTVTRPRVGVISPATRRSIVDFPQPDGPTRETNSPPDISPLTS